MHVHKSRLESDVSRFLSVVVVFVGVGLIDVWHNNELNSRLLWRSELIMFALTRLSKPVLHAL